MVEVVIFAVVKPRRHEELVLEVVGVARQLDEAEEIKDVRWCRDLPLMLQEEVPQPH